MREIIDGVDSDYFRPIFKDYYLRLQRGKHLEQFQIFPGIYYFPIDGSQFFSSKDIIANNAWSKNIKMDQKAIRIRYCKEELCILIAHKYSIYARTNCQYGRADKAGL